MKSDFITVYTDRLEESIKFYEDVLGFTLENRVDAGGGVTLVFLSDGHGGNLELIDRGEPLAATQNSPVAITIKVDDIFDTEKMIDAKGVTKTFGPVTMPSGVSLLHVVDPSGVTINFVQMGDFKE